MQQQKTYLKMLPIQKQSNINHKQNFQNTINNVSSKPKSIKSKHQFSQKHKRPVSFLCQHKKKTISKYCCCEYKKGKIGYGSGFC